jgi:hypothetical protein
MTVRKKSIRSAAHTLALHPYVIFSRVVRYTAVRRPNLPVHPSGFFHLRHGLAMWYLLHMKAAMGTEVVI